MCLSLYSPPTCTCVMMSLVDIVCTGIKLIANVRLHNQLSVLIDVHHTIFLMFCRIFCFIYPLAPLRGRAREGGRGSR